MNDSPPELKPDRTIHEEIDPTDGIYQQIKVPCTHCNALITLNYPSDYLGLPERLFQAASSIQASETGMNYSSPELKLDRTIHEEIDPTDGVYQQIKVPFTYFNQTLFNGSLPDCVLTLTHNSKRTLGYFRPGGFKHKDGAISDEIAMNPRIFLCDDLPYVLSIIVHEMAHMWKHHFGQKPCRGGYHCKEWGRKMDQLGLPPSNTGKLGGLRTGYQMMHYIEKDGAFDQACHELLAQGFAMSWGFAQQQMIHRKHAPNKQNKKLKSKYSCAACGLNAWAKPNVKLACVTCAALLQENIL